MTAPSAERSTTNVPGLARATAATVLLIGGFALTEQVPALNELISTPSELGTGRAAMTLLVLLSGLGLWLAVGRSVPFRRRYLRFCAALVVAAGGLAISVALRAVFLTHGRVADVLAVVQPLVGVMPVGTALNFVALGGALLLLDAENPDGHLPSQVLALLVVLSSLAVVLVYSYGARPMLEGMISLPPFYVAVSFGMLGAGILAAAPDGTLTRLIVSDSAGGRVIRILPAALMTGSLVLGWLTLDLQRGHAWNATLTLSVFVLMNTALLGLVIVGLAAVFDSEETARRRAERSARSKVSRQASVAGLGLSALSGIDPDQLLREAAALISGALDADLCEVLERREPDLFVLRASAGWRAEELDGATGRALPHPLARYALASGVPIVVEDFTRDARFAKPLPERLNAAASGAIVSLPIGTHTFGVITVYTHRHRSFGPDDIDFLRSIAGVLALAIDRARTDEALRRSEAKFANVFRACPDSISLITVADGRFIDVNESFLRLTGYTRQAVVGHPSSDVPIWAHAGDRETLIEHARTANGRAGLEVDFRTASGERRTSLCFGELITLGDEECLLTLARDISDRKRVEAMAEEVNEHLRRSVAQLERQTREISLVNDMSDLLHSCMTIGEASAIVVQFASRLFPHDAGALCLLSKDGSLIEAAGSWGDYAPEEGVFKPSDCWALRRGRPHVVGEDLSDVGGDHIAGLRCLHFTRPGPGFSICVPMMAQHETLGLLHVREGVGPPDRESGTRSAVAEARRRLAVTLAEHVALAIANLKLRETLRTQSIRDQLTGLLNRRYMEESLESELRRASRSRASVALVLLDVDRLKHVNDRVGHEAGDKLLQAVSRFLQARTREGDVLCRLGGDEFVIVMPGASLDDARDRAEQLLTGFRRVAIDFPGQNDFTPSLSMGLAIFPAHAGTGPGLLRAADLALYRAKAAGRDQLTVGQRVE